MHLGAATLELPTQEEMQAIANKIWLNECAGTVAGLTSWNQGEDFASLGIGHFIWYPKNEKQIAFAETFPSLLVFLNQHNEVLPSWLWSAKNGPAACPWKTREEFNHHTASPKMAELRNLLNSTIALQAKFMALRLANALPAMLKMLPEDRRRIVEDRFFRVAKEPMGLYVLVDYLNFKGEGTKPSESYAGKGWGLLQVLDSMNSSVEKPLVQFAEAARQVLQQRVANSPPERNETRWLKGWLNRIDTYTKL